MYRQWQFLLKKRIWKQSEFNLKCEQETGIKIALIALNDIKSEYQRKHAAQGLCNFALWFNPVFRRPHKLTGSLTFSLLDKYFNPGYRI